MSHDHPECIVPPPVEVPTIPVAPMESPMGAPAGAGSHEYGSKPKVKRKAPGRFFIPDPSDGHPIIRASKWIGAIVVILSALASFLIGVMKVGVMVNDLKEIQKSQAETRGDLTKIQRDLFAFQESFKVYKEERQRQEDIQREILRNLTTAVTSIQDITDQQRQTVRTRPRIRPLASGGGGSSSPPSGQMDIDSLLRELPPLPEPPPPYASPSPPAAFLTHTYPPISRARLGPSDVEFAEDTVDVALQRVEILQDQLDTEPAVPLRDPSLTPDASVPLDPPTEAAPSNQDREIPPPIGG